MLECSRSRGRWPIRCEETEWECFKARPVDRHGDRCLQPQGLQNSTVAVQSWEVSWGSWTAWWADTENNGLELRAGIHMTTIDSLSSSDETLEPRPSRSVLAEPTLTKSSLRLRRV